MNKRIIVAQDVIENMTYNLLNGSEKGTTTYIDDIDQAWTFRKGEVNIITGYANEGKSMFLRQLCLIKGLEEKKKFCFYTPEDMPAEFFFDELIHTLSGKSTDKDNPFCISPEEYIKCYEKINNIFTLIHISSPDNTVENIVKQWKTMLDHYAFIIDPYVRLTRSNKSPERDDLHASYLMGILNDFLIEHPDKIVFMVMHQQTPRRTDNGTYPEPNMYAVKSGGTFADTADNVLSIWRPNYAKDKLDTQVHFTSQKIKKQKLTGIPQTVKFRFNRKKNRYADFNNENIDIYDFSKHIK